MKSFQLFSVLVLLASAIGCSNGGRNNIAGRQCPENYVPIDLKFKADQKTWKKGDNESAIPVGTYAYQGSRLIYTEKGDKGAVVDIEDVGDKAGNFKTRVNCVRNGLNLTQKDLSAATNVVSKMIAAAGAPVDVEAKEISFRMNEKRLVTESKPVAKPASLEKAYTGKADDLFVIQTFSKLDYEVRSVYSDNVGSYVVSVKFRKVQ